MKLHYYKNLDGIRAIAIWLVMIFHFFHGIDIDTPLLVVLKKLSVFGQTGVSLFFVLSGFLITRILIFTKDNPDYFKTFYLRRTLRIFPLYYFFVFLFYFAYPLIFGSPLVPFSEQIYYYTYLQNIAKTFDMDVRGPGHFWSLAVEEHFYLFWPLVVYYFNGRQLLRAILLIIAGAFILRILLLLNHYEVYYFTFTRFDTLAIGALLALLEKKQVFQQKNIYKFLLLTLIVVAPTVFIWILTTGEGFLLIQVFKYNMLSFTYFMIIGFVLCLKSRHVFNQILESSFFTYTGKISYGLYVYHPFVYFFSKNFLYTGVWPIDLVIWFSLSYILAIVSFHTFESYFLRLKKHFKYSNTKPQTTHF